MRYFTLGWKEGSFTYKFPYFCQRWLSVQKIISPVSAKLAPLTPLAHQASKLTKYFHDFSEENPCRSLQQYHLLQIQPGPRSLSPTWPHSVGEIYQAMASSHQSWLSHYWCCIFSDLTQEQLFLLLTLSLHPSITKVLYWLHWKIYKLLENNNSLV